MVSDLRTGLVYQEMRVLLCSRTIYFEGSTVRQSRAKADRLNFGAVCRTEKVGKACAATTMEFFVSQDTNT